MVFIYNGIRPENICDNHFVDIKDSNNTINSKVDLIENIGSSLYLHTSVGSDTIASISGTSSIEANDNIDLTFDLSKSLFFKK